MDRDVRWEDVVLWVLAAFFMVAVTITVMIVDHRTQLENVCGNNAERAAAGILIDTSNKEFVRRCHETY